MNIVVKKFPESIVASVRHIGNYTDCKSAWHTLVKWAEKNNVINNKTVFLGISYDNPDLVKDCRYDACLTVSENFDKSLLIEEDIKIQTLPERKYMSAVHKGSYDGLYEFYNSLYNGTPSKQHEIIYTEPCLEVYLNSPENTPPADLLTEVFIPIK